MEEDGALNIRIKSFLVHSSLDILLCFMKGAILHFRWSKISLTNPALFLSVYRWRARNSRNMFLMVKEEHFGVEVKFGQVVCGLKTTGVHFRAKRTTVFLLTVFCLKKRLRHKKESREQKKWRKFNFFSTVMSILTNGIASLFDQPIDVTITLESFTRLDY